MNHDDVKKLRVALVEDFTTVDGGAQRVMRVFKEIWPDAPLYTASYFPEKFDPPLEGWDIRESFVSKFPFRRKLEHQYKLFYQMAFEHFDFTGFDLVLSSTWAGYAKGVIVPPGTRHFSYVCTVPRFLWGLPTANRGRLGFLYDKVILPPLEHYWRIWDRLSAERPDEMISISEVTKERVKKYWDRDSAIINPPVEVDAFLQEPSEAGGYFTYFGRLEKYKRVEYAIRACVEADKELKIVGTGDYESELRKLTDKIDKNNRISFLGRASDEIRNKVVAKADAFIFPCPDEDFGIVAVESMAAGTPVIAFDSGGVRETVIKNVTGVLVGEDSQEAITKAVKSFEADKFDSEKCRDHAKSFHKERFKERIIEFIIQNYEK